MPIDPSIPLGAQAPQFDISKLADLAQFGMQQKKQNALKAILADQENIDPTTGLPNTNAIRKIMGVDPTTGIKLLETDATLRQEQTKGKMDQMKIYQPLLKDAKDTLSNLLEPRIKEFGIDKAVEMTRGEYAETLKGLKAAGMPADVFGSIPPELTPAVANTLMAQAIGPEKKADLAQKDRTDVRLEAAEKEREKHDRETERLMADRLASGKDAATKKGWSDYVGKDGTVYRDNPNAGLTQKKVDGKWEDVDALPPNVRKPGATGGAPRSGIALFMQTYLDKNPDASPADLSRASAIFHRTQAAVGADVKADSSSLSNITKMSDAAAAFEDTAMKNFNTALKLADKGIPTNMGPWVNKWVETGETGTGNKDVPPYVAAILTGANEYAKVMSGTTGSQGSTVDSRKEARELFSPYFDKGQIDAVIKIAQQDMENKKSSYRAKRDEIKARITGESDVDENPKDRPKPEKDDKKPEAAADLPEAARAALQEGHVTTFKNGQKWTLKDGKPEKVE